MFIWTAKLHRGRLLAGAVALVVLCGAAALVGGARPARGVGAVSTTPASPKGIKTNEDRVAYLADFGWQVSPEPIATQEMLIPKEMDESYNEYLALQSGQGFDLEKYAGKRAKILQLCDKYSMIKNRHLRPGPTQRVRNGADAEERRPEAWRSSDAHTA